MIHSVKYLLHILLVTLVLTLTLGRSSAADPLYNMYTPSATTNAVIYSIIVPSYYHAAMNCYIDGSVITLKTFYNERSIATNKIEAKSVKNIVPNLPQLCTQPWRADTALADLLQVEEGTVLNQNLLDTMKKIYDGPSREVDLTKWLDQSRDCIQRLEENCEGVESHLYRLFMQEYESYVSFLAGRTSFVGDEEIAVSEWQNVQRRDGKSMDKQYAVFPTKQKEETTLSFQSLQTSLVVLQEFMQTYPMYHEFLAMERALKDTGIELSRIQRAVTQLLAKLPAIMACQ